MIPLPRAFPVTALLMLALSGVPASAQAERPAPTLTQAQAVQQTRLTETLKIPALIEVMRLEGLDYGKQMDEDMFSGNGGADWAAAVDLIYDSQTMQARFEQAFNARITETDDIARISDFFASDLGQKILTLEIEARHSLMDEAIEDAAKARAEDMEADGDPRFAQLQAFSDLNDLVESNISGALNANLAFFQGMAEAGALSEDMTEEDMLMDVWSQEPEIRAETVSWVYPYLALAYAPLSDAEMDEYLAFGATPSGQRLNAALFDAFNTVFVAISRDLGRAAARQMMGEDI